MRHLIDINQLKSHKPIHIQNYINLLRQQDYSFALHPVHFDSERTAETYMTYILRFFHGGHGIKYIFLVYPFANVWINGEVTHSKACKVLKEMRPLTGVYTIILQTCLDDNSGGTDMRPLDRDTQPIVAGAPSTRTDEHVIFPTLQELAVDTFNIISHIRIVHCGKVLVCLDIHHIGHVIAHAMTQRRMGTQQAISVVNRGKIFIQHLLTVHDRSNLKQIKRAGTVVIDIAGKFYFHRTTHLTSTERLHRLQNLGQREYALLQHTTVRDNLPTTGIDTLAYHLIIRVDGRSEIIQGIVFISLAHILFEDIKTIVYFEILTHIFHV